MTTAALLLELLPVLYRDRQPVLLQRSIDEPQPMWQLCQTDWSEHPHTSVRRALTHYFGSRPSPLVVHGTSWRHDAGRLILTYLIILPDDAELVARAGTLLFLPIQLDAQPARGETLAPPGAIARQQVLAHALDHLAWLTSVDPAIRATLRRTLWPSVLQQRLIQPARELHLGPQPQRRPSSDLLPLSALP